MFRKRLKAKKTLRKKLLFKKLFGYKEFGLENIFAREKVMNKIEMWVEVTDDQGFVAVRIGANGIAKGEG